ncbi:putative surface anchored protein [Streptococcus rupicaprae]|uniref:Surface anchored protein n=1 Tax=Streptococcus rupicaprae TaxID=759619 RepID=A0ABV2FGS3_9STRE
MKKCFTFFLTLSILLWLKTSQVTAESQGQDKEVLIQRLYLSRAQGEDAIDLVKQWELFRVNVDFVIPEDIAQGGGKTEIVLPTELKFGNLGDFDVQDEEGNVIGKARMNPGTKTLTVTYTDQILNRPRAEGTFFFYAQVDHHKDIPYMIPVDFTVDGQRLSAGELNFAGKEEQVETRINKSAWQEDANLNQATHVVSLNRSQESMEDLVVSEQLQHQNMVYLLDSFRVYKGQWSWQNHEWVLIDSVDITDQVSLSTSSQSYELSLGDLSPEEGVRIVYKTELTALPEIGQRLENQVHLDRAGHLRETVNGGYTYKKAGGFSQQMIYGLSIQVRDKQGLPVTGEFVQLFRTDTGEFVSSGSMDKEGHLIFRDLPKANYTIRMTIIKDGEAKKTEYFIGKEEFSQENPMLNYSIITKE